MADYSYTAMAIGIPSGPGKSLLGIFNGTGSGVTIKVYRIFVQAGYSGTTSGAVNGILSSLKITLTTSQSGGLPLTPVKHASGNPAVNASVLIATGAKIEGANIIRAFMVSTDEPTVSGAGLEDVMCLPRIGCVWDVGYGGEVCDPITLGEGAGLHVRHLGATATGYFDLYFEFTQV